MKSIKYLFLLFLVLPGISMAQNIAGLYTGTLYNDTTKMYYKYEIAISEEDGKLSGFSHTWFILDDQQYFGVKKVKVKQVDGKIIVEDEELLSNNYPVKPAKNVRQLNVLTLGDDGKILSGPFTTNATKTYRPLTGFIQLERKGNYRQSALVPHLEELGRVNVLSFLKEPENSSEAIAMVEKEKASVKNQPLKEEANAKLAKQKVAADLALANQIKEIEKIKKEQDAIAATQAKAAADKIRKEEEDLLALQKQKVKDAEKLALQKAEEDKKQLALQAEKEAALAKKNKEEAARIEKEQQAAIAKQRLAEKERIKQEEVQALAAASAKKAVDEKLAKEQIIAKEKSLTLQKEKETAMALQQKLEAEKAKQELEMAANFAKQKETDQQKIIEKQKSQQQAIVFRNADAPAADLLLRTNVVQQTVEFTSDSLLISLYDNGEVDGDTVSVILNGEIILAKQRLSTNAVKKTIYIPAGTDRIELIMYAESLGTIPPNTGLLIVRDGKKYYEVRFSGDMQKNAAIIFNRKKE